MSEGKGYAVIVKINLPPEKQYHSGHSLIVQGDDPDEVALILGATVGGGVEQGALILEQFGAFALAKAVEGALTKPADPPVPGAEAASSSAAGATKDAAKVAGATVTAPVSDPDAPASAGLLKVAAKKVGKTVGELGSLTTAEAKALIKG